MLDTPPSRNALDFLDAPDRLRAFFEGRALQTLLRGGGAGLRLLGARHGPRARAARDASPAPSCCSDLSDFFRLLGGLLGGFRERAAAGRGAAARARHDVPARHLARARADRRGDVLPAAAARRAAWRSAARSSTACTPTSSGTRTARRRPAGAAAARGRPVARARAAGRGRVRRRARARAPRRGQRRAPRRAARRGRAAAARPAAATATCTTSRGWCGCDARAVGARCAVDSNDGPSPSATRPPARPRARSELPRSAHADWVTPPRAARPDRAAGGAGGEPRAGAGADPLRAHVRLAVRVLPRRGGGDGGRPRADARRRASACSCAATRTCRTSAASPRPSATSCSTSTTSTRRCRARGSGTSSGSRRASRSPARERGLPRARAARDRARAAARVPRGDARARRACARSTSGTRASTSSELAKQVRARAGDDAAQQRFERTTAKARRKDSTRAFAKLTHRVDGEPRIASDPPLIVPIERACCPTDAGGRARGGMRELIAAYRATLPADRRRLLDRFRYADIARKVVGVGSVGTRAWIVLMLGRDDDDPLFLQCKEAQPSVLAPFAGREPLREPGPARRRGPAADAGGERHLPRLDPHDRASTAASATSTCASCGTGRRSADVDAMERRRAGRLRAAVRLDARPRPRPLAATRSRSPPTSAPATPSTARSPTSPRPTPTRTSATTPRCSTAIDAGRVRAADRRLSRRRYEYASARPSGAASRSHAREADGCAERS